MGCELKFSYQETLTQDMFLLSTRKSMGKKIHVVFTRRTLLRLFSHIFNHILSEKGLARVNYSSPSYYHNTYMSLL